MKIIVLEEIKKLLSTIDLLPAIEQGFIAYSQGRVVVPPVGELSFKNPPGDVHIKYGYIRHDPYYVIKVASGFYENAALNLPTSHGLMLIFSQKTGALQAILLDEGYLTDVRTAAAGAIVAKHLAPAQVSCIGVLGTGMQARLQLQYLKSVTSCREVIVWGRHHQNLLNFKALMDAQGFSIHTTQHIEELTQACNLIITTTPATAPLLKAAQIKEGTHITAVGADTPEKQELDPQILSKADLVIADSVAQCIERGEIAHAIRHQVIQKNKIIELGNILSGLTTGRTGERQITVADLTGVAIQDIQIAKLIYEQEGL